MNRVKLWLLSIPLWAFASLLANATIIATEYLNRTQPTLLAAWSRTWPLILVAQACLYFSYNRAPSLLMAWIVFTVGNSMMRLTMAYLFLKEPFHAQWAVGGALLMALASYCIKKATG